MIGEPGLLALLIVPLIAVVFAKGVSRSRRCWTASVVLVSALFSQSFATVLAVAAAMSLGVIAVLWARRAYLIVVTVIAAAAIVGTSVVKAALGEKASVAAASFTDRGIANLGGGSAAMYGNINMLVMFSNDPVLALTLLAGLVLGFAYAARTLGGLLAFLGFAIVVVVAQPTQWHPGGWLLIALASVLAVEARERFAPQSRLTASLERSPSATSPGRPSGRPGLVA